MALQTSSSHYTVRTLGSVKAFIMDMSGFSEDDAVQAMMDLRAELEQQNDPYVTIYNIGDFMVTRKYKDYSKSVAAFVKEQGISKGTAIVGVTGMKKIFAKAIKPSAYWASSMEDALKWAEKIK